MQANEVDNFAFTTLIKWQYMGHYMGHDLCENFNNLIDGDDTKDNDDSIPNHD